MVAAALAFTGDPLDLKRCTEAVGFEPTDCGASAVRTGTMADDQPYFRQPFWMLGLKQRCYSIEEPLTKLLDMLWHRRDPIRELVRDAGYTAKFLGFVTIHEDRPLYELSGATLKRLAYFGFEYLLDIVDYS